ncbi:MAG: hypothetical protein EXR79_03755 [Myxococcales bacterium]|nr:hypothetical protein [Myxococcales bacterium]
MHGIHCTPRGIAIGLALALGITLAGGAAHAGGVIKGHEQTLQRNRHGLGFIAGVDGTLGFAYRNYLGNSAIQINALPLFADYGDYLSVRLGAQVINYMLVWSRGQGMAVVPGATALRVVGAYGLYLSRDQTANVNVAPENCKTVQCQKITEPGKGAVETWHSLAAGFGFEFGAVMRPGFSIALDLLMTLRWDRDGFYGAYPLPSGALTYSW